MSRRRVVVTGLGLISPVGNDVAAGWENLLAGRSGIGRITRFDAAAYSSQIAGEVRGFDVTQWMPAKEARHFDTFIHYGIAASTQAVRDAGITADTVNPERVGVIVGSGIGGLPMIEDNHAELVNRGPRRVSPYYVPGSIVNLVSGQVSIMHGFQGPNYAVVSACTTGLHSIGDAGRLIEYGDADVMIAGGAEATVSPLGIAGFCSARAMSTRNDDPTTASRPWDRDRDGFVLGEGSGVLVLEEYEHARRRGARIYGELSGYGDQVQYVNAHGTSTPLGDKNETEAIKLAFGDHAHKLVINSTKSMTGHLLGAAGGVESVFTVLAVHNQVSPPTINIFNQDPECDLDYCANQAREMRIDAAISNSFGFGGTNGSLVVKRLT